MSRNIRQKFPAPPAKVTKRRGSDSSSSLNLSDDNGYSAVEDISEDDDEEEDVQAAEERHIIKNEARFGTSSRSPRPRSSDDEDEDADEEDVDDDDDALSVSTVGEQDDDHDSDGSNIYMNDDGSDIEGSSPSWNGIASEGDGTSGTETRSQTQRHVRFDVPSSDSDSTETDDDISGFFPDLFVDQNTLDPAFRREIEHDEDDSSTSSAFWDHYGSSYRAAPDADNRNARNWSFGEPEFQARDGVDVEILPEWNPEGRLQLEESDGYSSDGDTTEDDVPELLVRRAAEKPSESSGSESTKKARLRPGKPRLGSFDLNNSTFKPVVVVNPITRKMMIFTQCRRDQLDLSPEQFNVDFWTSATDRSILSNSAGLMMGAMVSSSTFGDFINAQPIRPEDCWFPVIHDDMVEISSDSIPSDFEADAAERELNVEDFLTLEDGDSSDEDEGGASTKLEDDAADGDSDNTAGQSPGQRRPSDDLLMHLTPERVSSFRRNQLHQQLLSSSQATVDSLDFSSPFHHTALRGLKMDRFETATTSLTPIRRFKKQMVDVSKTPPGTQKRKASGEEIAAHKRQRSISDVNSLHI